MSTAALLDRPVARPQANSRTVSLLDRLPAPEVRKAPGEQGIAAGAEGAAEVELDLRGLDYVTRRRRLIAALARLRTTERLRVTSSRVDDVYWLRFELEARLGTRYRWFVSSRNQQPAVHTVARLDS